MLLGRQRGPRITPLKLTSRASALNAKRTRSMYIASWHASYICPISHPQHVVLTGCQFTSLCKDCSGTANRTGVLVIPSAVQDVSLITPDTPQARCRAHHGLRLKVLHGLYRQVYPKARPQARRRARRAVHLKALRRVHRQAHLKARCPVRCRAHHKPCLKVPRRLHRQAHRRAGRKVRHQAQHQV